MGLLFGFKSKAQKLREQLHAEFDSGERLEAAATAVQALPEPRRIPGKAQAWRGIVSFVTDDSRQVVIGSAEVQEVRAEEDGTCTILLAPSAPFIAIEVRPLVHAEKWLTLKDQRWRRRSERS